VRWNVLYQAINSMTATAIAFGIGIVLLLAGHAMAHHTFTVGDFALFVYFLQFATSAATSFGNFLGDYANQSVSIVRMEELVRPESPDVLLEFESEAEKVNRRIIAAAKQAGIPVVLLDRRNSRVPEPKRADLVGLNNRQAGYSATEHLVKHGAKRIGFLGYHGAAGTMRSERAATNRRCTHTACARLWKQGCTSI